MTDAITRTFWTSDTLEDYAAARTDFRTEQRIAVSEEAANLVSSLNENGLHSPLLDIDYAARLVPSSSANHFHLYLDGVEMPWWKYKLLLRVLAFVGIVQPGYVKHSINRKMTMVRKPGVRKITAAEYRQRVRDSIAAGQSSPGAEWVVMGPCS